MSKVSKVEQQEALDTLRKMLKPGETVYTVLRHVSSSGMTRDIDLYVIEDNRPCYISGLVSRATGTRLSPRGSSIRVGGVGMDMGFHLVYGLSRVVFAEGFHCTGEQYGKNRCPANDHFNERFTEDGYSTGRIHSDPGYALQHEWM